MGLADLIKEAKTNESDPYDCLDDRIRELVDGRVVRKKSGEGYTYYAGIDRRGRSFASLQPNIWIYLDPIVRIGVYASTPLEIVIESALFERVPSNEK